MKIPLLTPYITEDDERAVLEALRSGWITQGPRVAAFEQDFAACTGANHACAVSSATTGLHMALLAVGVQPGDEVITVSHSFIATANAVRYCGATPVFVDIDPDTLNMDVRLVEKAIGPKSRAILCVHQIGMPCDLEALLALASRHSLPVVEDAACAAGSLVRIDGTFEPVGKPHGDIACFSFHPRKVLTTGDGGMLTTNNPEYDDLFRKLRQHGLSISDVARHSADTVTFEEYTCLGYNYRMTDLQAALGCSQLKSLPWLIEERRRLAERYVHLLADCSAVSLPLEPEYARSNWQTYSIRLAPRYNQREVMQALLDAGVSTRRGIMNAHTEPAYGPGTWKCGACGRTDGTCECLRESLAARNECLQIPLFPGMTAEQQDYVAGKLLHVLA